MKQIKCLYPQARFIHHGEQHGIVCDFSETYEAARYGANLSIWLDACKLGVSLLVGWKA